MNTFPLYKILTLVGLVFFTSMGWGADDKLPDDKETQEACELKCAKKARTDSECAGKDGDKYTGCVAKKKDACMEEFTCLTKPLRVDLKDDKQRCKDDTKTLNEKYTKMNEACNGFTQKKDSEGKSVSCAQKLKNCQAQMDGAFSMNGSNDGLSILESLANAQIAKSVSGNVDVSSILGNQSKSCIKEFDPKEVRNAEEKLKKEKKDLEEKIKKEAEKQAKLREEQRDKQDKITKQVSELEAENKKENLKKDKSMREQTAAISKNTVEIGQRLRGYATAMRQENQKLATENQAYQIALLDLTDEKIVQKCKQEFDSLKAAIVNAKADPNGTPEQKQLAALAATFKANGIQGSGDLRSLLTLTKKNCFEKASTQKNQNALKHTQAIENVQGRIDELKKTMEDEKQKLTLDQENLKKIQAETDAEKTAEQKEKETKLQNLNTEMTNFITSIEEKNKISTTEAAKLTADIKNLVLKTDFNAEPAFSDAENAIDSYQNARTDVIGSCCPGMSADKSTKENRAAQKAALKSAPPICKRVNGDGFGDPTNAAESPNGLTDYLQ